MTLRQPELSVVIPAFNEASRIGPTLRSTIDFLDNDGRLAEVIVVDDGSSDGTSALVGSFMSDESRVRLIRLPQNRGKGYAVRAGVVNAAGRRVLFIDADGATPISELRRLEQSMEAGADIVIGSRALESGEVSVKTNVLRRVIGRIFHQLVRRLAVSEFADTQCGFKLFTAQAAQQLFSRMRMNGFSFDVELLTLARRHGMVIVEKPVNWTHQPGSKVSVVRDGLRMAGDLFRIRARMMRGVYDHPHIATAWSGGRGTSDELHSGTLAGVS